MEPIMSILQPILEITLMVYNQCQKVKSNKKHCAHLSKRVSLLVELLKAAQEQDLCDKTVLVRKALTELGEVLQTAMELVQAHVDACWIERMWNTEEMGQQFDPLNMRLSQAADTLSLALQVKHRDQLQEVFNDLRRQKEDEEDRRVDLEEWLTRRMTPITDYDVGRYGDVMKTETTGASAATARQDGNNEISGKPASFELAETDLDRMNEYKDIIIKVGRETGVDPAVIAGIISRSSRAGSEHVLEDGWNANRDTFGLMQITKQWHKLKGDWDREEHIKQGTGILISSIRDIKRRFLNWTKEQQLKGGIAAYYAGPRNVPAEYEKVDENTFAKDYSNYVVARAQFYREHGFL
ncbi:lysozyme g-like [Alosa pseudoharengus]|uniref:lysozyme g-like n=1 Tax=Alosa pseudoharengus TaxID=34774 RepID=UPI003F8AC707